MYDFADTAAENPTFYADLDNPQTLNKYQYCFNNPLNAIDPDGHSIWTKLVKVVVKVAKTGSAVEAFRDNINDAKTVADSSKAKAYRAVTKDMVSRGRMRDAMARDIRDVRRVASPKYNKAIKEMLDYSRRQNLIQKAH